MTSTENEARAAVDALSALQQDDFLLSELVMASLADRRWWTRQSLLDAVGAWLRGSDSWKIARIVDVYERCGLVVRRGVRGRKDRFALTWRAKGPRGDGLRTALAKAERRRRLCVEVEREMAREQRARQEFVK